MSIDKTKTKSQAARPLMPRLATYNVPSRSSPTPRLAAQATPPSTTRPRLAAAKSMSNLVHTTTPSNTPTPSARTAAASVTPRSVVRRPKLESTKSTPTAPVTRAPLIPLKQGPSTALNTRTRSTVGSRGIPEKNTPSRGPVLAKSRDVARAGSPQSPPITPRLSPSLEGIGESFFLANDATSTKSTAKKGAPSKAVGFVRANGEEDEPAPGTAGPRVATHTPSTLGRSSTIQPKKSDDVSTIGMAPKLAELAQIRNRNVSVSPTNDVRGCAPAYRPGLLTVEQAEVTTALQPMFELRTATHNIGPSNAVEHVLPPPARLLPSPIFLNAESVGIDGQEAIPRLSISPQHVPASPMCTQSTSGKAPEIAAKSLRLSSRRRITSDDEAHVARSPESSVISHSKSQYSSEASEVVQSPPTSVSDIGGKGFDHAASARRDRKVLDLEISNSSLLVINSTLERELRRQKTELRRFRRLTRTNGLDWLAAEAEDGSSISPRKVRDDDLTDHDSSVEGESEDEFSENASASSDDPNGAGTKRRHSDIKLLQLDVAKHREILADSQKMNQSLRRCMGLAEQLIKDANKAISYKVRHSDIQLGGRVLAHEEDVNDSHVLPLNDRDDIDDDNESPLYTGTPQKDYFEGVYEQRNGPEAARRVFSKPLSEVMREMF